MVVAKFLNYAHFEVFSFHFSGLWFQPATMNVDNLGHIPNMPNRYLIEMAVRDLDPLTTWNIVSEKVLSHFKIWDLLVHKVFRYAHQQITDEGLQHLAGEVDLLIKELKQFLIVRCDNKTRQSFLTSGYLDQNLARLISTGTFPPPIPARPAEVPTTDFRNMPYHYETNNDAVAVAAAAAAHRDTNVAMLALANVKTEYGGSKHEAAFQQQHNQYQPQANFYANNLANNAATSPPPSQPPPNHAHQTMPHGQHPHVQNVGKIDRAIQLQPSELEGPLSQDESEYEAMAKKRKRWINSGKTQNSNFNLI